MKTIIERMTSRGLLVVSLDAHGVVVTLGGATSGNCVETIAPVVAHGTTYTHAIGKVALTAAEYAAIDAAIAPIRELEALEGELIDLVAAWEAARGRMDFVAAAKIEPALEAKRSQLATARAS